MKPAVADLSGVSGAILAALCCAGSPWIVAGLTATGLIALRQDAILWPVMLVSLAVAVWGFWRGFAQHGSRTPLVLGSIGAANLAAGVIWVHGPPAMAMIYGGSIALLVAALLNIRARRACEPSGAHPSA